MSGKRGHTVLSAAFVGLWCLTCLAEAEQWTQRAKLIVDPANARDNFGTSVAISGNVAIVGAPQVSGIGSAYLFDVSSSEQLFRLGADDWEGGDEFGYSVAISAGTAVVGARFHSGGGAAYTFDVATGQELLKLTPDDAEKTGGFGKSVAIDGNRTLVGAYLSDDDGTNSGAAYIFDTSSGQQLLKLVTEDIAEHDWLGRSVAIDGNIAVVAAPGDGHAGTKSGAAYLFDVSTGEQLFKLTAADAAAGDSFGRSVAIDGDVVIVGADRNVPGSAYVFDAASGEQLFQLTADNTAEVDLFGISVGISGDIAIVGGILSGGSEVGSAHLFDVATGEQVFEFTPFDVGPDDRFGRSVAIDGPTVIVGAYQDDEAGSSAGSAYIFVPEPSTLFLLATAAVGVLLIASRRRRNL